MDLEGTKDIFVPKKLEDFTSNVDHIFGDGDILNSSLSWFRS